ncbi:hypothetical protein K435DRAFT_784272 [Dendrothele bispora CBS 962.96]|uniref:Uncharacterized protein n=1 Tax=Dendrothele bispora (strain CBS 962.96) TaxID=1314807 RepID=A0A4V4HCG7_DENBC|nr:hypothetical protein K435DRAFT_784272 [Dendrothele bispora CBS 962.96]
MNVFNPKILDASIRDVASRLSDNQKADLLLYAMNSLSYEGPSRIIFENAIQSCLQVSTLSQENAAKARILRARVRMRAGALFGAHEDLHAALAAEPDNPEAKALLHQRSVNVEKLLAPLPFSTALSRFSIEIWREIALFLSGKDLRTLLFVPGPLSRIASSLLFRRIDLHFGNVRHSSHPTLATSSDSDDESWRLGPSNNRDKREYQDGSNRRRDISNARHAQRTADILTRIITDHSFASVVRTLRIYTFSDVGTHGEPGIVGAGYGNGSMDFQTGILSNALPKLTNLQQVHVSSPACGLLPLLHILQTSHPRLRGLSLQIPDGQIDLSSLTLKHLVHFSYEINSASSLTTSVGNSPSLSSSSDPTSAPSISSFLLQNRAHLQTLAIEDPSGAFPTTTSVAIRNLTHLKFLGQIPLASSQLVPDLLQHGRQIESLNLTVLIDCPLSPYFRSLANSLPFLRYFSFHVAGSVTPSRRLDDRDLFPSIADFLRDRRNLKTLGLTVASGSNSSSSNTGSESTLRLTGFDSSIWGVLPSLTGLKGLTITYPKDLAPALGMWLIPRTVVRLMIDGFANIGGHGLRDPVGLLNQIRPGVPPSLLFIALNDFPLRSASQIVEQGFPMVRLIRLGTTYWTVLNNLDGYVPGSSYGLSSTGRTSPRPRSSGSTYSQVSSPHSHHSHSRPHSKTGSPSLFHHTTPLTTPPLMSAYMSGPGMAPIPIAPAGGLPAGMSTSASMGLSSATMSTGPSSNSIAGGSLAGHGRRGNVNALELEEWPKRRSAFHLREWLQWLGCEEGQAPEHREFIFR